jgi:hypothetical protein
MVDRCAERCMVLELLGAVVVIATIWAALQLEGLPTDSCASGGSDPCADKGIRCAPLSAEAATTRQDLLAARVGQI